MSGNKSFLGKKEVIVSRSCMWLKCYLVPSGNIVNIINIYAPLEIHEKQRCLIELSGILEKIGNDPCVMMGDFNCVRVDFEEKTAHTGARIQKILMTSSEATI